MRDGFQFIKNYLNPSTALIFTTCKQNFVQTTRPFHPTVSALIAMHAYLGNPLPQYCKDAGNSNSLMLPGFQFIKNFLNPSAALIFTICKQNFVQKTRPFYPTVSALIAMHAYLGNPLPQYCKDAGNSKSVMRHGFQFMKKYLNPTTYLSY